MNKKQLISHFKGMLAPMGVAFLQAQLPPPVAALLPPGFVDSLPALLRDENEGDEETGTPQNYVQYFALRDKVSDASFRAAVERLMMTDGNLQIGMQIAFAVIQHSKQGG